MAQVREQEDAEPVVVREAPEVVAAGRLQAFRNQNHPEDPLNHRCLPDRRE
jgi:hypothetical protein